MNHTLAAVLTLLAASATCSNDLAHSLPRYAAIAAQPNRVAGTWLARSAAYITNGTTTFPFGSSPAGIFVFGHDFYFTAVAVDPAVPPFAEDDRLAGTPSENAAAVAGTFGISGTYTVDQNGDFASQHVVACTYPNWIGIERTTAVLTMNVVNATTMIERLIASQDINFEVVWERAEYAGKASQNERRRPISQ